MSTNAIPVVAVLGRRGATAAKGESLSKLRAVPASDEIDVAALWQEHHVHMVRLARLLVDDIPTAEDVVQEAFLQLHRRQDDVRDPRAAVGYLRTSVVNGARSTLRRRRTVRDHLKAAEPEVAPAADEEVVIRDEHRQVWEAVQLLPERQREVIVLRYWSDLSEAQIAQALGISPGTVKSQASKAMKSIARTMEEGR